MKNNQSGKNAVLVVFEKCHDCEGGYMENRLSLEQFRVTEVLILYNRLKMLFHYGLYRGVKKWRFAFCSFLIVKHVAGKIEPFSFEIKKRKLPLNGLQNLRNHDTVIK